MTSMTLLTLITAILSLSAAVTSLITNVIAARKQRRELRAKTPAPHHPKPLAKAPAPRRPKRLTKRRRR